MNLPNPPARYTPGTEAERNRALEAADARTLKRDQDVELRAGARIIIASPDGSRWALTVSNAGALSCTKL